MYYKDSVPVTLTDFVAGFFPFVEGLILSSQMSRMTFNYRYMRRYSENDLTILKAQYRTYRIRTYGTINCLNVNSLCSGEMRWGSGWQANNRKLKTSFPC